MSATAGAGAPSRPGRRMPSLGDPLRRGWERLPTGVRIAGVLAGVVVLFLLPVINPPGISTETVGNVNFPLAMADFARTALVALGLNVVVGLAGLLDLGYIGFFAIGAYVVAILTSPDSSLPFKLAWLACVPIAMVVTSLSGVLLGLPTLRLRGDYLAIVTLGFGEIVRLLADNVGPLKGQSGFEAIAFPIVGRSAQRPQGFFAQGNQVPPITIGTAWYWLGFLLCGIVLLVVRNLERSRVGRAWVALREDEDAAEIMGVSTFAFKLRAFAFGAAVGGLAGAMFVGQLQFVNNGKFDVLSSILFVAAVVIGGQGNKVGVIVGAFLITYIPAWFNNYADYKFLFFGIILLVVMLFRPQGILPARHTLIGVNAPNVTSDVVLVEDQANSGSPSQQVNL
jgi:branched-chain amino acid transport system permease protein